MVDHKSEARRLVSDETLEVALEGEESELYASAQVHATLALVAATEKVAEQARIANVIAYWQLHTPRHVEESMNNGQIEVTNMYTEDDRNVDNEVRAGIGL